MLVGAGERESSGIPWRIVDDLSLVVYRKRVLSMAELFHELVTVNGLAEIDMKDHIVKPKYHPAPCPEC